MAATRDNGDGDDKLLKEEKTRAANAALEKNDQNNLAVSGIAAHSLYLPYSSIRLEVLRPIAVPYFG